MAALNVPPLFRVSHPYLVQHVGDKSVQGFPRVQGDLEVLLPEWSV
jgi:hypothetical protein